MLETLCHSDSAFVTLTYADDMLPSDMSLNPVTLQLFVKRLRSAVSPLRIRYYAVGEYGDQSERPHYHLILFGYRSCLNGRSMYTRRRLQCCSQCDRVRDSWGLGFVGLGSVTMESAAYCCSYITKNMRRTDDLRLKGRWPEFARMSLRPGIGYDALWEIADTMMRYDLDESGEDVPTGIRHGAKVLPLGRYLRRSLRTMVGKDEKAPDEVIEELQVMYEVAKAATPSGGDARRTVFKNLIVDAGDQRVKQMAKRISIYKGRREL